jgi:hypothetical protein
MPSTGFLAGPQYRRGVCETLNNEPLNLGWLVAAARLTERPRPGIDFALQTPHVEEAVRMFSLVDHYRRLANEAGERAQQATDPSLKSTFAELAQGYARLELAEQRQT